jgi:hypothetical protein
MAARRVATSAALLAAAFLAVAGGPCRAESDPKAVALAESTLVRMGGRDAWAHTHYLQWNFFGRRKHTWDRFTGMDRIETGDRIVLVNIQTHDGHVFDKGAEITDPAAKKAALDLGYGWWVNDSYWLIMPYKLLDPGVNLKYLGPSKLSDGRAADLLGLTFGAGIGMTPENRYDVWIARDTGLVEQWSYYAAAADTAPQFTMAWKGWKRFGKMLLATDHGQGEPWETAAPDSVPRALFEKP